MLTDPDASLRTQLETRLFQTHHTGSGSYSHPTVQCAELRFE